MASVFQDLVKKKVQAFRGKYKRFHSAHEALGLLWEEFEELKKEVFKRKRIKDPLRFINELVDIAAYCEIFAEDVTKFVPGRNHMPIPE
jgi:hypothetical protein